MLLLIAIMLIRILQSKVACDYDTLTNCGAYKDCWQHLDAEIYEIIRGNINNETEACGNFWYYACGSWTGSKEYHSDNFGLMMDNYAKRMETILKQESRTDKSVELEQQVPHLLQKLRDYYQSCSQTKLHYPEMARYLQELPEAQSWLWPKWRELIASNETWSPTNNKFNWLSAIAELRRYGLNGVIIEQRITMAYNDAQKYVIEVKMPAESDNFEKKFELINYLVEFGLIDGVTDQHWELAASIFDLEKQLKELRAKHRQDKDATFEESLTLSELQQKVPNIDWNASYFKVLLGFDHIDADLRIEVNGISYFQEVTNLLTQSEPKIVTLYILLRLCKYVLDIRPQMSSKHCIEHMGVVMPLGMNYVYKSTLYENYENDEAALQLIFEKLKTQFGKYLAANKLHLNEQEKCYLQLKSAKMQLRLGNLPQNISLTAYDHYFDAVHLNATNFYRNHWEILRFRTAEQQQNLRRNQGNIELASYYVYDDISQIRNAPYFVHERNLLIVPLIFMQLPFFHHKLNALLQQSLVGFILGHEFNHAFEYQGIIMDAFGNESPIGYAIKRKPAFVSGLKCLQQTTTASLVERMADVNGFQLAYDAFFSDNGHNEDNENNNVKVSDLPQTNWTASQMFFLNFAQFFCGHLPEPIDHDRDDLRVNQIVSNMPEFRQAFRCPIRQAEDHIEVCQMWR